MNAIREGITYGLIAGISTAVASAFFFSAFASLGLIPWFVVVPLSLSSAFGCGIGNAIVWGLKARKSARAIVGGQIEQPPIDEESIVYFDETP